MCLPAGFSGRVTIDGVPQFGYIDVAKMEIHRIIPYLGS
jgi:hypothetical protein